RSHPLPRQPRSARGCGDRAREDRFSVGRQCVDPGADRAPARASRSPRRPRQRRGAGVRARAGGHARERHRPVGRRGNADRRRRGLHAAREGRASDAVRAFERAREAMPESVIDRLILAEALIDAGERARATGELEAMRRAHAADPEVFAAASRLLARVRSMEGAPNDALRLLELAAEVFGDDAALLETVGLASLHAGENVRGAAFLQSAQRMAADRAGILAGLGYLRYGQGELDEAERLLASSQRSVDEAVEAPLSSWIETAMTAIRDLGRLEVWRDPFNGADGPMIDGWDAHELFGI